MPWDLRQPEGATLEASGFYAARPPASVGNALGRWPFPATPPHVSGVPRGYLIEATK